MESEHSDPQQNIFTFDTIAFSSAFDSGNLKNVIKLNDLTVNSL